MMDWNPLPQKKSGECERKNTRGWLVPLNGKEPKPLLHLGREEKSFGLTKKKKTDTCRGESVSEPAEEEDRG